MVRHFNEVPSSPEETLTSQAERQEDLGLISNQQARTHSGLPIETHDLITVSSIGIPTVAEKAHLEEVTDDHQPAPGAKREATLRNPRKPRTAREKMAADQPPERQRVTPLGHDYPMTVHHGGRR